MPAPVPRAQASAAGAFATARRPAAGVSRGAEFDARYDASGFPVALFAPASSHEVYAAGSDAAVATAFALAGLGAAAAAGASRPLVWVRHAAIDGEAGAPYGPGLERFGLSLGSVTLLRTADALDTLRAGLEGARHLASGVVLVEIWGDAKALDFTATRRLALAAETSGATVFVVRLAAEPRPSAARTKWRVGAAASRPLFACAPGAPCLVATLLRDRGGSAPASWALEWRRDEERFALRARDVGAPNVDVPDFGIPAASGRNDFDPGLDAPRTHGGGLPAPLRGAVVPFPADKPRPEPEEIERSGIDSPRIESPGSQNPWIKRAGARPNGIPRAG